MKSALHMVCLRSVGTKREVIGFASRESDWESCRRVESIEGGHKGCRNYLEEDRAVERVEGVWVLH